MSVEKSKQKWTNDLDALNNKVSDLETLHLSHELFKKWGIGGYLKVSMNEDNVRELKERIEELNTQKESLKKRLEGRLFTDKEKEEQSKNVDDLSIRINTLLEAVETHLKKMDKSEERKKEEEALAEKVKEYKKELEKNKIIVNAKRAEILKKLETQRKEDFERRYNTGIFNVMRAKAGFLPLEDDEAQVLQRKQAVFDEIRIQKQLASEGLLSLPDQSTEGMLKLLKQSADSGMIAGEQYGKAIATGVTEFASELFWTSMNTTLLFFTWPIALPIKLVNFWFLGPVAAICNGVSGGMDEAILKGAIPAWKDFIKDFPEGGVGINILRAGAAVLGFPLVLAGGALSYIAKGLAYGSEKLHKYINWDNMMRTVGGPIAGGLLGGGVGIGVTVALLVLAPFTFGVTAGILAGLWVGIGISAGVGIAKGLKNAKEAGKAEINLELSAEDSNRLMEWEHRHPNLLISKTLETPTPNVIASERAKLELVGEKDFKKKFEHTIGTLVNEHEKNVSEQDKLTVGTHKTITVVADHQRDPQKDQQRDLKKDKEMDKQAMHQSTPAGQKTASEPSKASPEHSARSPFEPRPRSASTPPSSKKT